MPQDELANSPSVGVGSRIRAFRKLAPGLTQTALARRMHVSASLVKKVEQGIAPASPTFVAAAAKALSLTVFDLYEAASPSVGTERAGISDLEIAVMAGGAVVNDEPAKPVQDLARRVDEIAVLQRRSRYDLSSALMPQLLTELHVAAEAAAGDREREVANRLLATVYGAAVFCLHRLGSVLTGQAAERAAAAARLSGDPLLASLAEAEVGLALMHRGAYGPAERLTDQARRSIDDVPTGADKYSLNGYFHLRSAIISARTGDRQSSDAHLKEAGDLGQRLPDGSNLYDTAFCSANVTIHAVAAAVELGDGTTAVARNQPLPAGTMPSRLGHHYVDLARAWLLHGDRDKAFGSLQEARAVAPQLTRYHPQVRETLAVLAEKDRRRTDSLSGFARWAGVQF